MTKSNVTIKRLTKQQMETVYNSHMRKDFPDNERKPLAMILEGMDKGTYECLGLFNSTPDLENEPTVDDWEKYLLGYAIFVSQDKDYLFDYLAVTDGNRQNGAGTVFLEKLAEYYGEAHSVIGEVEDPDCSENEQERILQTRRYDFYMRNGYVDTGVRVILFGVHYRVIELKLNETHTESRIKELYKKHYKAMLTKEKYDSMVTIKE